MSNIVIIYTSQAVTLFHLQNECEQSQRCGFPFPAQLLMFGQTADHNILVQIKNYHNIAFELIYQSKLRSLRYVVDVFRTIEVVEL